MPEPVQTEHCELVARSVAFIQEDSGVVTDMEMGELIREYA